VATTSLFAVRGIHVYHRGYVHREYDH